MAISPSSYSVGNRVYNGASSAPTRGQVDPMGYVDRELNKPSQSRSGLAEAALAQLKGMQPGSPGTSGMGMGDPTQGLGMPSPVGTPPMAQRQLTVTPTGQHVFMDMIPNNTMNNPLAMAAQKMLSGAGSGPLGQVSM